MKLSPNEIAWCASQFWPQAEWINATAVSLAESGGDTEAMGRSTTGTAIGNRDHGLWQLSNYWHQRMGDGSPGPLLKVGSMWRDPLVNARLAFGIWNVKRNWVPWHVWGTDPLKPTGSVLTYLPDATIAVRAPWEPPRDLTRHVQSILDVIDLVPAEFFARWRENLTR